MLIGKVFCAVSARYQLCEMPMLWTWDGLLWLLFPKPKACDTKFTDTLGVILKYPSGDGSGSERWSGSSSSSSSSSSSKGSNIGSASVQMDIQMQWHHGKLDKIALIISLKMFSYYSKSTFFNTADSSKSRQLRWHGPQPMNTTVCQMLSCWTKNLSGATNSSRNSSNVIPLCLSYKVILNKPKFSLQAWFIAKLAHSFMLFILQPIYTAASVGWWANK